MAIGMCAAHLIPIPVIVTWPMGTPKALVEGAPSLNIGAVGVCSCGCPATALESSNTVMDMGLGAHRMKDVGLTGAGTYSILLGTPTVMAGD